MTKELMVLTQGVAPACARCPGNDRRERRRQPFVALCQGDPGRARLMECAEKSVMDPNDADREWWWVAGQPDYHGWCLICRKPGNDPSTGTMAYIDHGNSNMRKKKVQACTNSNEYALDRFKANVAWCITSKHVEASMRANASRWL